MYRIETLWMMIMLEKHRQRQRKKPKQADVPLASYLFIGTPTEVVPTTQVDFCSVATGPGGFPTALIGFPSGCAICHGRRLKAKKAFPSEPLMVPPSFGSQLHLRPTNTKLEYYCTFVLSYCPLSHLLSLAFLAASVEWTDLLNGSIDWADTPYRDA